MGRRSCAARFRDKSKKPRRGALDPLLQSCFFGPLGPSRGRLRSRPFIVVNPRSAGGATARHFDSVLQAARGAVGDCAHAFTRSPMHAAELTREALRSGHDLIVAVGGDGTCNEVVNGFFEPARPGEPAKAIQPGAALAILPRGTGGDLRRTLKLDNHLQRTAERLKGAAARADVGRCDFVDEQG